MTKLLLLALMCCFNCSGQTETKEDFLNKIFSTVYSKPKYCLFYRTVSVKSIDTFELHTMKEELKEKLQPNLLSELYTNAKIGSVDTLWDFSKLFNAKTFNNDSANLFSLFESVTIVKNGWSESKILRQEKKQSKRRDKKIAEIGGGLYYFSCPVFDNLRQYAIISMSYYCGNTCGSHCFYLFQKINGKWEKITSTNCWVS